jgi:hypothetical protein
MIKYVLQPDVNVALQVAVFKAGFSAYVENKRLAHVAYSHCPGRPLLNNCTLDIYLWRFWKDISYVWTGMVRMKNFHKINCVELISKIATILVHNLRKMLKTKHWGYFTFERLFNSSESEAQFRIAGLYLDNFLNLL